MSEIRDAMIFKAFCDKIRLQILAQLKTGEKCGCKLYETVNISQSALSYHMKVLVNSGIVKARVDGKWTFYRLSNSGGIIAQQRLSALLELE